MAKKKRNLSIRITYESNRLAKNYLSTAYELLIPTVKRPLKPTVVNSQTEDEIPLKQSGGKPK